MNPKNLNQILFHTFSKFQIFENMRIREIFVDLRQGKSLPKMLEIQSRLSKIIHACGTFRLQNLEEIC
jgi:hypothetical protein